MFWTNTAQAEERLVGSIVLYDGSPCYIEAVREDAAGNTSGIVRMLPSTENTSSPPKTVQKTLDLSDKKFEDFRKLPPTGWYNNYSKGDAFYIEREIVGTRTHGLSIRNTSCGYFYSKDGFGSLDRTENTLFDLYKDFGYTDAAKGVFPSLQDILQHQGKQKAVAYSSQYCVMRNDKGLRILFRGKERIGFFTGNNSFFLLDNKGFYKEELQEDPLFTVENIQEF